MQKYGSFRFHGNDHGCWHRLLAAGVLALLGVACGGPVVPAAAEPAAAPVFPCGADGRLAVELYGSIRTSIDWHPADLTCTGMPRPDGEGARVRLSGPIVDGDDTRTLAFILGLPGLEVGQTGKELPTNVTLIEEGTGRFFGTADTSGCWTDVTEQDAVSDDDHVFRIRGTVYCVSPLAELNGNTSVTFTELVFSGRLDWKQPE